MWREGRKHISLFCAGVNKLVSVLLPLQTVVTLENGKLVQKQTWDGKETNIEREISDGKLIAVRIMFFLFFWEIKPGEFVVTLQPRLK